MAKFCGKCGAKLDDTTGLCPNCDVDKLKEQSDKSELVETPKPKQDVVPEVEKPLSKKEAKKKRKADKKETKKAKKKEEWAKLTTGQKVRRFFLKLFLAFFLLCIVVCGVTGTLEYFNIIDIPYISTLLESVGIKEHNTELNLEYSQFKSVSGTCITRSVNNENDALAAIDDLSEVFGIKNVSEEFGDCKADNVLNNSYYRFEQKYKGISVYGRSMSVSADSDGNCLLITGNYSTLDDIDTHIIFDEESAEKLIRDSYEDIVSIYNNGLTIYSLNGVSPEQAWNFYVSASGVTKNVFISTISGNILAELELNFTESVECSGDDVDDNNRRFTAEKVNSLYVMQDTNRGISVYDANNSTLEKECVIIDSNESIYTIEDGNWIDDSGNVVNIDGENYSFVITDGSGNRVGEDGEYAIRLKTQNVFTDVEPVTSKKSDWSNKKAVTLMADIASIYDFWSNYFGRQGFDGKHGEIAAIYDDYMNIGADGWYLIGDTTNAYSWGALGLPITVLSFGSDNSLAEDVIGHEYMHSVERSISNMVYQGESGALMEAYSDIFGEILQDWIDDNQLNDSCDWIHNSNRNMMNPSLGSYPDTYQGTHWVSTFDTDNDHGGVHKNNTVISHAAYLMWTGIGGNPAFESLNTSELAKLFYSTLFSIPSDCTFSQFRNVLQNTADILCEQGVLTNKQRLCVSNAMFQVGISPEPITYAVLGEFELCTYDIEGKLYDDYTISIAELDLANMPQGPGIEPARKDAVVYQVQTSEPYGIFLTPGVYEITLTDNKNDTDKYVFNVITITSGESTVFVSTTFGVTSEMNLNGKYDASNVPSDAVEFNGHHYYLYNLDTVTTWEEAKEYCESQGGYLATITSQEEDDFLYSYITDIGYDSVLFGLSDTDQDNMWAWVTGEPFSYENWASGEPNHQGGYEHYGMYYEKNKDGSWNDGSGKTCPFLCEWGEYQTPNSQAQEPIRTTSDERDIVLVLDTSGSMSGTPIEETKKAATKFVNTILEEDASIGIVTYEDSANQLSDFSIDKGYLTGKVENISDGGGTNIESGLAEAKSMLDSSNAKKKIIVLMSDGEPNEGKEGEDLIAYADDIKSDDILIYTLGFFENMSGSKSSAQYLMEQLASDGCHYEVASADDLVFFFEDMADQINGQKYIYVRIACPVDVSVTYNGETLSSAESALNVRTDFGTLTFEDNENVTSDNEDDRIKVLRLKEGADYDVQIVGTGRGMMDYTIGFMDENGDYNDFRRFEDVKITKRTVIDTLAAVSDESVLNIDENGDGKYDVKLRAEENGYGEEVKTPVWLYVGIAGGAVLLVIIVLAVVKVRKSKKKGTVKS